MGQSEVISTHNVIEIDSRVMTDTVENWWYTLVSGNIVLPRREALKLLFEAKFVLQDSVIRARNKLTKLRQKTSVAAYFKEFINLAINIPGMSEFEKLARFCEGFKPHILLEGRKWNPDKFEAANCSHFSVDGAFYGSYFFTTGVPFSKNLNASDVCQWR